MRVLVLVGLSHELMILANYVKEQPDLFKHCDVMIRKYPYSWDSEQEEGIALLKSLMPNIRVGEGELLEQVRWCDVALYCSTSAGVEAMMSGRLSVFVALHDIFNLDPTLGKGDLSKIYRSQGPQNLNRIIREIQEMDDEDYQKALERQGEFARGIYSPIDRQELADILAD